MRKYLLIVAIFAVLLTITSISSAATYYGDTDGDGTVETVTWTASEFSIYHPRTGLTSHYNISNVQAGYVGLFDTDGVPGMEIVYIWTISGSGSGVSVIHDKTGVTKPYPYNAGADLTVRQNYVVDTDGISGSEIIVLWGQAPAGGIDVIHDKTETTMHYPYDMSGIAYLSINSVIDTDGVSGSEIIALYKIGTSNTRLDVIHDKTRETHSYLTNVVFGITAIRDFDGITGADICISYVSGSTSLIGLVVDRVEQTLGSLASCAVANFTINASAGTNGAIDPSGAVKVTQGTRQTFRIIPNVGYRVLDVVVDGTSQGSIGSYEFTNIQANHTIAASFERQPYTITAIAGSNGTISPASATVFYGDTYTFTVQANLGYRASVTGCGGALNVNGTSYTTGSITGDCTVTATFIDAVAPTTTISPADSILSAAETITLTANEPAVIYYTTDGSTPTTALPSHTNPASLTISQPTILKFFARDTAGNSEAVKTVVYTLPSYGPQESVHCNMAQDPWSCWDSGNETCNGDNMNLFVCPAGATKTCNDVSGSSWLGDDWYWNYRTVSCAVAAAGSHVITISKDGDGSGTVTSTTAGVSCGSDCAEAYVDGTAVTLTAVPAIGSVFTGWSGGACSGTGNCTLTINATVTVTATFRSNFTVAVAKAGTGAGTVTGSGINCGSDCSESYPQGSQVTLAATPASGSFFTGWSGGCTGTEPCVLTMNSDKSVTATFNVPSTYGPWQSQICDDSNGAECWDSSYDTCNGDIYGSYTCPGNTNGTCNDVANYGFHFETEWWDYRTVTCVSGP